MSLPQPPNGLNFGLLALGVGQRRTQTGLLAAGLFGSGGSQHTGLFESAAAKALKEAKKRRVFFSFHYQNDINRVNIVRQSWRFRPDDDSQPADWFDHSIWEESKKKGERALKDLIHGGMHYSSVTCVLAGTDTWARPWVRYEIAHALSRGNGLLTVYIHGLKCMKTQTACAKGKNPLDYIGLKWGDDGKAYIWENFNGAWRLYARHPEAVAWPKWLRNVSDRKYIMPLSASAASYDYLLQDGYSNLSTWTHNAAKQAGR